VKSKVSTLAGHSRELHHGLRLRVPQRVADTLPSRYCSSSRGVPGRLISRRKFGLSTHLLHASCKNFRAPAVVPTPPHKRCFMIVPCAQSSAMPRLLRVLPTPLYFLLHASAQTISSNIVEIALVSLDLVASLLSLSIVTSLVLQSA
jgi:hypothetical protein